MRWAERPEPCRCPGDWPHPCSRNAGTRTPYFSSGEMKMIGQCKRTPHDPVTKYTLGQTPRKAPTWSLRQAWPHRSHWQKQTALAAPRCSSPARPRRDLQSPRTQHVLRLRDHHTGALRNTNGPDTKGASDSHSGNDTGDSRSINETHTISWACHLGYIISSHTSACHFLFRRQKQNHRVNLMDPKSHR